VGKGGSEWRLANAECVVVVPSGNRRQDGTTRMDNFVCYPCQEEARIMREVRGGDVPKSFQNGMNGL